jgi:putative ATP-binding cassette transporter
MQRNDARTLAVSARPQRFLGRAFALVHPYWSRSDERHVAWALLIAILALTLGLVYLNVLYNLWNRNFFNALEARDTTAFWSLIPYFFGLSALTIAGTALQAYLTQMLQMRWRVWMTSQYLDRWLAERRYYHLELDPRGTDNPDQRVAEDLKQLTTSTLDLSLGLLHNVVTLVSFIAILWSVSHLVSFSLFGSTWSLPGDMVWAALLYAAIGSAATYLVGRPLIGFRFQQERLEADLRFSLMRTREHAEGIALYRGETAERASIDRGIGGLKANWRDIMRATLKLNALSSTYVQIGLLFPYFLAAPRYFAGQITLGGLTQIAGAFDTVRSSLSWFVFSYQSLAMWKASIDRLLTFEAAIEAAGRAEADAQRIVREPDGGVELRIDDLQLAAPTGRPIASIPTLHVNSGERILLRGPPGTGKSTLFRAIAGLWPFGTGRIHLPASGRMLFLPQKAYIPIGRLAAAVSYPSMPGAFSSTSLTEALAAVGMGALVERLDENANWSQVLSGGEQQRLAIARALLHGPDWLFLDESTSAVDEETEAQLYGLLHDRLRATTIVSIAHRPALAALHERSVWLHSAAVGAS